MKHQEFFQASEKTQMEILLHEQRICLDGIRNQTTSDARIEELQVELIEIDCLIALVKEIMGT